MWTLTCQLGKVTRSIFISSTGRSWLLVSTMPIRLRTPMPWQTLPNILCLPSSHCVGARVKKNWLPFVSGPALAMARIPAPKNPPPQNRQWSTLQSSQEEKDAWHKFHISEIVTKTTHTKPKINITYLGKLICVNSWMKSWDHDGVKQPNSFWDAIRKKVLISTATCILRLYYKSFSISKLHKL